MGERLRASFGVDVVRDWKLASAKDTFFRDGVLVGASNGIVVESLAAPAFSLGVSAVLNFLIGEARGIGANLAGCVVAADMGVAPPLVGVVKLNSEKAISTLAVRSWVGSRFEKPAGALLGLAVRSREERAVGEGVRLPEGGLKVNFGKFIAYPYSGGDCETLTR